MKETERVKTININGIKVDIGLDDYGQCYFFEYEKNGQIIQQGCGTYNETYLDDIYYELDPRYKELVKKELFGNELTDYELDILKQYQDLFIQIYRG